MAQHAAERSGRRLRRRDLLAGGALLGTSALLASQAKLGELADLVRTAEAAELPAGGYDLVDPYNILYSVCQQCNTQCGIKAKLRDGVLVKLDGNPFSPWNLDPHVPYRTSPFETAALDGRLCPKGQASIQMAYDPYRIVKVLKRAGKRGENKWMTIPFEQAVREIVDGGYLFSHVPGEENRKVDGLKEIWALRDAALAKAMADEVKIIQGKKTPEEKKAAVEAFKAKFRDQLHVLIDPDHPDLGPKNNQLFFLWGRLKGGRGELIRRFTVDAFGSRNAHGHTTVCQGSLYFTGKAMSEQYVDGKWTGGKKFFWQADQQASEFIIFVGVNPFEASQGPTNRTQRIAQAVSEGRLKYVVIDPVLSRTAGTMAWKWLPNIPGTEAAVALALVRWIIDNRRYDERYLRNANKAAAAADGEPTWCNAAWLVKIEQDGTPGKFLRASEAGIAAKQTRPTSDGKGTYQFDPFVVSVDGRLVPVDPYDTTTPVEGDLLVSTEVAGIKVKTAFQVLTDQAHQKTMAQWAQIAGLPLADLVEVAREFTSHGKKAAVDIHRGVSQHTNGLYNCTAWFALPLLIGSFDWKGGMVAGATYDPTGGKPGQPFNLGKLHPSKTTAFGVSIIRDGDSYESSTLFTQYPAKRPWYPLASDIYQEAIPSAGDGYPYPIKALFIYMGSPAYSLPSGHTNIAILADPSKIPLVVANDIIIGETSMYADYIFPDCTYLERWEFAGTQFSMPWKVQPVRQPVIAPLTETVKVFGQEMPATLEAMLLGLAERLGLPGFGKNGFGPGQDFLRGEDLYLRMVANLAAGEKTDGSDAVPDADDRELDLFIRSRRHLPATVFDPGRWAGTVGERWWRKVVYVLNRGGRFEDFAAAYQGEQLKNKYGTLINLYQEKTATTRSAMTGKPFLGVANYTPAPRDLLDRPVADAQYDLRLITHRVVFHTKSRTISNYWLLNILPEGEFLMNTRDAERLGLKTGDVVKVVSATNPEGVWDLQHGRKKPMVGKLKVIEGIRPGVVSFSLGHGHWAYGSQDVVIDGRVIRGDHRRSHGLHANAAMRTDPVLPNTCLADPVGASAVFYDTQVRLVKV
ncbi:MAG: molybdopterin-dependent oxidoreductase [Armatimonadota bacterium]|nr:molybdopterin-dependent oxidoreductase [Armatimonadota bacterium]MDR7451311.1 molybdopterin-dependent oxidoreductase [Armatimonadota bacterium]MDR7466786.1 molybdopterin-dependent oxidoreductase [Armatimonadota bacterium]MDR7492741.1 molybdopterin-dependent oxidoreductase [Armatimonadota bacterium]MDR7498517.1 molybdopterin-dependent oxidoreductase [Armatimonadota bacterium]